MFSATVLFPLVMGAYIAIIGEALSRIVYEGTGMFL